MGSLTANAPLPNIQKKPRILGVLGTILFWALFALFVTYFSLFSRKPVYKTVQIRLDSPQTKTQDARAAAAPKSMEKSAEPAQALPPPPAPQTAPAQTQPAAQTAPVQTPPAQNKPAQTKPAPQKQNETPKPAPAQKKVASEPVIQKSIEELMAEQQAAKPKKKLSQAEIAALFENTSANTSATSATTAPSQVQEVAALSGSAGTASNETKPVSTTSTQSRNTSTAASTGTTNALRDIAATSYSKVSGNGVSSVATVKTGGTTDGKVAVQMTDGTARTLLEPESPSISLSSEAAALIDGKKEVRITFSVSPSGTVAVSGIRITPAAILAPKVRDEVTAQISRWRFSSADSSSSAILEYTIDVK